MRLSADAVLLSSPRPAVIANITDIVQFLLLDDTNTSNSTTTGSSSSSSSWTMGAVSVRIFYHFI